MKLLLCHRTPPSYPEIKLSSAELALRTVQPHYFGIVADAVNDHLATRITHSILVLVPGDIAQVNESQPGSFPNLVSLL
jgi:hypothetical protein